MELSRSSGVTMWDTMWVAHSIDEMVEFNGLKLNGHKI